MNAPIQIELYLPPPITAREAAAILGHLGGKVRAQRLREPILKVARRMREELKLPPHGALQ